MSWLMWLWRSSSPTIYCLKARETGKRVMWFSLILKALRTGAWMYEAREDGSFSPSRMHSPFLCLFVLFIPQQVGGCPPELVRRPSLVSLRMQVLIFSRDTLIDITWSNAIWVSLNPVKFSHKTNHHKWQKKYFLCVKRIKEHRYAYIELIPNM